jgi:hypothetical protein
MTTTILRLPRIKTFSLPSLNWKAICFLGFLMCSLLLIFYVYQVNSLIAGKYLINNYEEKFKAISAENKKLELGFAENNFLSEVLSKTQDMNFQKIISVKYIQIPDGAIAKK